MDWKHSDWQENFFMAKNFPRSSPSARILMKEIFQFLWGIMAARAQSGVREAKNFAQGYQFEDNWAENNRHDSRRPSDS